MYPALKVGSHAADKVLARPTAPDERDIAGAIEPDLPVSAVTAMGLPMFFL